MRNGIDVSVYQGEIDWRAVRASDVDWAMIKCSQGTYEAERFKDNINRAYACGIQCGVYHFLTAENAAALDKEVDFLLALLTRYKPLIKLYVCLDVESNKLPANSADLTAMVRNAYQRIEAAGYQCIVYTNLSWLRTRLLDISDLRVWLAWWRDKDKLPNRSVHPSLARMMLWQWGTGNVDGISGAVDCNLMIEDEATAAVTDYAGHWAEAAIEAVKAAGLMQGDPDGRFRPDDAVTRGELAAVLARLGERA